MWSEKEGEKEKERDIYRARKRERKRKRDIYREKKRGKSGEMGK